MAYTYTDFAELRVPDDAAADDVAAHLSFLAEQLDPVLTGQADSTSDRDSKFFAAPAGFLCKVVNPPSHPTAPNELVGLYVKNKPANLIGWYTLYAPEAVFTESPVALVDGYEARQVGREPTCIQENLYFASLRGEIVHSDASNIAFGETFGYLPDNFNSANSFDFPCAIAYGATGGIARIAVIAGSGALTYYGPTVGWVGIDGIRFRLAGS